MILRSGRRKESTSTLLRTRQNSYKKNRVVMRSQTQLSDLPSELLIEILSRLPVTCLLRTAKCTCKLWHSIISDSSFADFHLKLTKNSRPGHLYALSTADSDYYFADNPTIAIKLPVDLRTTEKKTKYRHFSSCRGLLSYRSVPNNSIYICNPITGDQFKLPDIKFPTDRWGFGYAPSSNKYKYIQFSFQRQPDNNFSFIGMVFTLGEECWRKLSFFSDDIYYWLANPVYCNGALYWLVHCMLPKSVYHVLSFDLDTEKFRPRQVHSTVNSLEVPAMGPPSYLTLYGETVALVACIRKNATQEVWVLMNEAENVWVEKYRFHYNHCLWDEELDTLLAKLWIKRHGENLELDSVYNEVTKGEYLLYDAACKTYPACATGVKLPLVNRSYMHAGADGISPNQVIFHVGSLLSPSKIGTAAAKKPNLLTT